MPKVKFITPKYLKQNTALEGNVDNDLISPYIIKAQDTFLQDRIGSALYARLQNGFNASNLTAAETTLIEDYIQPMLAEFTLYYLYPHLNYKLTNKAVSQLNGEFSQPSTLAEVNSLRQACRDLGEYYGRRMLIYIRDNINDFSTYQDAEQNPYPRRKSYFGGMYIPGVSTSYCDDDTPDNQDPNA